MGSRNAKISNGTEQSKVGNKEMYRAERVFTYWLRSIISIGNVSHRDLAPIVLKYYFVFGNLWNPLRTHRYIRIEEDLATFTRLGRRGDSGFVSVCSNIEFSENTASIIRWEVTIKKKGIDNHTSFMMGYIDANYISTYDKSLQFTKRGGAALKVDDGGFPKKCKRGKTRTIHEFWVFETQINDRFRIDIDFKNRSCSAHYNDEWIGIFDNRLRSNIYLTASLSGVGASFQTTSLQLLA